MEEEKISYVIEKILESYKNGGKVIVCGNGSSACQAQDMSANLINRFKVNRKPIECLDLTSNTAVLTSIANDFGFENIFSRQIEAYAKKSDVLIGISTSGNSANVINAIKKAKGLGCYTIALSGKGGGKLKEISDISLIAKAEETFKIQEEHLSIIHSICEKVEDSCLSINS